MSTEPLTQDPAVLARLAAEVQEAGQEYEDARAILSAAEESVRRAREEWSKCGDAVGEAYAKSDLAQRRLLAYAMTGEVLPDGWKPWRKPSSTVAVEAEAARRGEP